VAHYQGLAGQRKVAIADLNQIGADAGAAKLAGPDRCVIGITMDVTLADRMLSHHRSPWVDPDPVTDGLKSLRCP
jgi:hypothetical protein